MTEQEYVDKINRCDTELGNGNVEGFTYLHYLECDMVDPLSRVEQGLLKVLSDLENANHLNLEAEKRDLKSVLDAYYEVIKEAENKYQHKIDHILWDRILPKFK